MTAEGLDAFESVIGEDLAPPRRNGEFIFDAPWKSRAFGMAILLQREHAYTWDEFAQTLATQEPAADYYSRWLAALERLLVDQGALSPQEIEARTHDFASGAFDHH